ncbi:hypothetical protein PV326_002680 [Microctonus aethiopoides]|nr:hypothetical protein PV326_002680 [Microctonus aethiopoides]
MATLDTEIRKLRPIELYSLAKILSPDFWKILMGNIKKPGSQVPMFTSEHITLIEIAATKQPRSASEIFLDEWGTMGRKRPTIKMAIDLLVEAEFFRAADFLAVEVLKGTPPERPSKGPAAQIKIPDDIFNYGNQQENPLDTDSDIGYHSKAIPDDTVCSDNHRTTLPLYLNSDSRMIEGEFFESNEYNDRNIIVNELSNSGGSDLIKFSSDDDESKKNEMDRNNILNETNLNVVNDINNWNEQSTSCLPNLSILKLDSQKHKTVEKLTVGESINFPAELTSSELPLCINDGIAVSSYQESYSNSEFSITSTMSSNSRYTTSDNNIEENNYYGLTADVIKPNKLENEKKVSDNIQHNIDYNDLPLTVMEFCKQ